MIIIKDKVYNVKVAENTIISMFKRFPEILEKQERFSFIYSKKRDFIIEKQIALHFLQ